MTPSADPAARYIGLSVDEAREQARRDGRRLRLVKPGDLVTMEYVEDRITATTVADRVIRATTG